MTLRSLVLTLPLLLLFFGSTAQAAIVTDPPLNLTQEEQLDRLFTSKCQRIVAPLCVGIVTLSPLAPVVAIFLTGIAEGICENVLLAAQNTTFDHKTAEDHGP